MGVLLDEARCHETSARIDHATVRNSSSIGIQVSPIAGTQVTLDTVAVTNNAGIAVRHITPGPSLSYRNLTLQGNGDYDGAVSLTNGKGIIGEQLQQDLDRLTYADIPVDIVFSQGPAELGL